MPETVDLVLWGMQGLLALLFLFAGWNHAFRFEKAKLTYKWMADLGPMKVRPVGVLEILAAIGVVAPHATGILPILTPLAAAGLVLLMLGATGFHVLRKEWPNAALVLAQGALAGAVAYGRYALVPYAA